MGELECGRGRGREQLYMVAAQASFSDATHRGLPTVTSCGPRAPVEGDTNATLVSAGTFSKSSMFQENGRLADQLRRIP